jgi:transcriptional regulator with XRE-family HTH domain
MVKFNHDFIKYRSIVKYRPIPYYRERMEQKGMVSRMELSIGKVIFELRKKNGVTQEQLANAVGVSVPAVSKWETGNSYPDITLLMPLARYLGVTVDDLLHYQSEISHEKEEEIIKECALSFEKDGFDTGLALCNDYLNEYPNNLRLKYQLASLLPWYAAKSGTSEENVKAAKERAVCLLKDAAKSDDSKTRNAALYLLACTYIQMDKSKEAQETLEQLPQQSFDPNYLLPIIYLQQKEYSKAIKLNQSNLLLSLNKAVGALTGLVNIAVKEEKWEDALRFADAQRKLIEAIDLQDYMLPTNCQLYLSIYSRMKDAENTLHYLNQYLSVFPYDLSKLRLSDNFFFSLAEKRETTVALNFTKDTVLRALEESKDFDFLRSDARFQNLLDGFRNGIPR